jgi:hypothetical protein
MSRNNRDYTKRLDYGESSYTSYHRRRSRSDSSSGFEVVKAGVAVVVTGSERDSVEKCSAKTPDIQDRLVYTEALRVPS